MAFVKSATDLTDPEDPVVHATAHWRIVHISMVRADRYASILLYGYPNRAKGRRGKGAIPGAAKQYSLAAADFDAFNTIVEAAGNKSLYGKAYDYVKTVLDVPGATESDPKTNFFAGATEEND